MSYSPPLFTDAGGSLSPGYAAPSFGSAGGDVAPPVPPGLYEEVSAEQFGYGVGLVLLAEFFFEGGRYIQRVATDWWYSQASDSIGVKEFTGRIISEPSYDIELGCYIWGKKTSFSVGAIEVADPNGDLDWMQRKHRDSLCVLRLAQPFQPYDQTRIVGKFIVDSVDMDGVRKLVNLRGFDTILDRPLMSAVYQPASVSSSSSTSSEPDLTSQLPPETAAGNAVIEGEPFPLALGDVYQCAPVLVDANELIFQIADLGVIDIDAVLSGGSVANPPDSSDEEWDYTFKRTSFRMTSSPSARVTAHCSGVRALTPATISSDFSLSTAWSSDAPDGWAASGASSDAALSFSLGSGARFEGGPLLGYGVSLSRASGLTVGDWMVVLVNVSDVSAGYVVVEGFEGGAKEIRREGRHVLFGLADASEEVVIGGFTDGSTPCDVTIASVHCYGLESATGTESLIELVRHLTIARGGIPDADAVAVDVISASSGDFDTSEDLNRPTIYTNVATVEVSGGKLDFVVGNLANAAYAQAIWPAGMLQEGEQYTVTATVVVTTLTGSGAVAFRFDPDSFWPGSYITLQNITAVGTYSVNVTFIAPESGTFVINSFVDGGGLLEFTVDDLRLTGLGFSDDGATVNFDSLSAIDDGHEYGMVADGRETVRDAVQQVLDSFSGWMFPGVEGRIEFGRLALPSGIPALRLSDLNILGIPRYKPDLAPGLSDTVAAQRNWSPYSDAELAGITYPNRPPFMAAYRSKRRGASAGSLARQYTHAIGAPAIPSLFATDAAAAQEADRVTALYSAGNLGFWEVDVALPSALDAALIQPGLVVELDDPLFAQDEGKIAAVVGVGGRYRSNVVKLIVWGANDG